MFKRTGSERIPMSSLLPDTLVARTMALNFLQKPKIWQSTNYKRTTFKVQNLQKKKLKKGKGTIVYLFIC